jgi:phosphate transport system permease protein
MEPKKNLHSFQRETRRSVKVVEVLAETAIRVGGLGTIGAVALMMAFLFWVAWPLFRAPSIGEISQVQGSGMGAEVLQLSVDEGGHLAWFLEPGAHLRCVQISSGKSYLEMDLFPGFEATAFSAPLVGDEYLFGFSNGFLASAHIQFRTEAIVEAEFPAGVAPLALGEKRLIGSDFFERNPEGSLRRTHFKAEAGELIESGAKGAIHSIDRVKAPTGTFIGMLDSNGETHVVRLRETENWMTGEVEVEVKRTELTSLLTDFKGTPAKILLGDGGTQAFIFFASGRLVYLDLQKFSTPQFVESIDLMAPGRNFASAEFLPGRTTLLVADDQGVLNTWFPVRPEEGGAAHLTLIHGFDDAPGVVQALAFSSRSRLFLAGRTGGHITASQGTLGTHVLDLKVPKDETLLKLGFYPRQDGVLALTDKGLHNWRIDFGYPEVNFKSLFRPIWYEGYTAPEHVWQSSASSDDFEPKIGVWPLVFGTLKATFFAMLFGAPIAVLGALFTSEYMTGRSRAITKTLVELLAGLPSVVLGFLAALVVAPFVQEYLSVTLAAFFLVPGILLLGAYLWQLQPTNKRRKRAGAPRLLVILLCPVITILLALSAGPAIENIFFAGDSEAWLDHRVGEAFSGWFFLMIPLMGMLTALGFTIKSGGGSNAKTSMLRFLMGSAITIAAAVLVAWILQVAGFDARGGIIDTYVQRNALIVGIAVGLVVLPIVYTLTEDALGEVPGALREASLGAGATQWQTAVRVVLPFATSGIFSALMVGLGRAVGETMIVLMAAGNTPLTEWNVFNGFRTLAANIAVEIPEAVVDSSHYRVLFLTALILFSMTFVINTLAELVRRHFRAKVKAL